MKNLSDIQDFITDILVVLSSVVIVAALLTSCAPGSYVSVGVTETKLSESEAQVVSDFMAKLKSSEYWHAELDSVFIESANREKLTKNCGGPNIGCTDTVGILLIEEHPAFCTVLAHEFQHIIKHIETGDADAGHSDTHAFFQWPSQFCAGIANPFVKTSACLNPLLCGGANE